MKTLYQNIKRDKRNFQIVEDGILVDFETAKNNQKYKVLFTEIRPEVVRDRNSPDVVVVMLIFSLLLNVIFCMASLENLFEVSMSGGKIVLMVLLLLFAIAFVFFKERLLASDIKFIPAEKPLQFLYSKQYRLEVDKFIDEIFKARQTFFIKKYYKIDNILPFSTQKNNIVWLYQNEYITESEAKFILNELETQRIIGQTWDTDEEF